MPPPLSFLQSLGAAMAPKAAVPQESPQENYVGEKAYDQGEMAGRGAGEQLAWNQGLGDTTGAAAGARAGMAVGPADAAGQAAGTAMTQSRPLVGSGLAMDPNGPPPGAGGADMRGVVDGPQAMMRTVGGAPAREVSLFGPKQWGAIGLARQAGEAANQAMEARSVAQAKVEEATNFQQAERAEQVVQAQQASKAQRDQEAQDRLADMDRTVKDISSMRVDPNRFWNQKSTGQRIMISLAMGLSGWGGRPDEVSAMVNNAIDRDIKAQEFEQNARVKKLDAQKSIYGQMLDKYQSTDAAQNLTRAAMLDAVAAQARQMGAQQKSVDAQNMAEKFAAGLSEQARDFTLKGFQYQQATGATRKYVVMRGGVPVEMTSGEYNKYQDERDKAGDNAVEKGLDRDIKREEIRGKSGEDTNKAVQHISDQIQGAHIPQLEGALRQARAALDGTPITTGERAFKGVPGVGASKFAQSVVLGDDVVQRDQQVQSIKNTLKKEIAGASMSPQEKEDLVAQIDGAGNQAALMTTMRNLQNTIDTQKANIYQGQPPEAIARFKSNSTVADAAASSVPSTFKVSK